jgi:hypothetical protein
VVARIYDLDSVLSTKNLNIDKQFTLNSVVTAMNFTLALLDDITGTINLHDIQRLQYLIARMENDVNLQQQVCSLHLEKR